MKVGLKCVGGEGRIGPDYISTVAAEGERLGFASFLVGDHALTFDEYPRSNYPYRAMSGGNSPVPDPRVPILDPIVAMTWAAAATTSMTIGTSVIILPQRNPIVLAKQLATLDLLTKGRLQVGLGVGWCREEYDAIGVPWEGRGRRTDEYIEAMRALWRDDSATYHGEYVSFERAYCYPKPLRDRSVPIYIGGESEAGLRRAARLGDGWVSVDTNPSNATTRITRLRELVREAGRPAGAVTVSVDIFSTTTLDDLKALRDAGVDEFTLSPGAGLNSADEAGLRSSLAGLARQFVGPASSL